ncbi:hypothetical protein NLG97_g5506 [Lecanicillium saksenae]|uniref:Uncharacterized protein n=1 Tax=Lecanicillium saksenae TaxID=468837 RepID=A0ACC1QTL4_9HYPO|nr:hypothetical protein NLG97_g5506 [Lecanicillium saksenae]
MATLLDTLRQASHVDCDTMDRRVAETLGPFVDCTSNQAIAYFELSRDGGEQYRRLWTDAIACAAGSLHHLSGDATQEEFVVEIAKMIKLQLSFLPFTSGYVHVQTNPKLSFSTEKTVKNAQRINSVFKALVAEVDAQRVCIKIPATWEGLQACRSLEAQGIKTLATTLFCMEQASLAAEANCTYIAPYVNELRVHFDKGFVDEHKAFAFCAETQNYYKKIGTKTQVLVASLTSTDEVMQLAGVQHITISPPLLEELAATALDSWQSRSAIIFENRSGLKSYSRDDFKDIIHDESAWRLAFARSGFGTSHAKIIQAINYFSDFQEKLERMVQNYQ